MNFTPQVETREISDADLDNVSGGLVGELVSNVTATVDSVYPVSGTVAGAVSTIEGATGISTAPVTGAVSGLTAGL
ncbi:hypothetical protein [Streptomyces jeddahensis]|uniref:Type A2 lantipeptide n=1 Tax=Streptomyces jeddahensis TaxID=1716141 RepID=A0A177HGY5_9ACTN|nr:hypothetical protein [Streptomyces jeddahensis]OAH10273.1 hypothetical protein STSP_65290 [Streptomyces jeddahensis]